MEKEKMFMVILVGMLAFGLVFVSCGGSSTLVGEWVIGNGSYAPSDFPDNLYLFKGGAGEVDGRSISWKAEGKHLTIKYIVTEDEFVYKVSGKKLTLTADNGRSTTYIKR